MLRAVLFDMDGVLVDSEPVHFAADYKMMKETFGIELLYEDYRKYIGSTIEKIWKFFREKYEITEYTWEELMDKAETVLAEMVEKDGYPEIPGVVSVIKELKSKGYLLAVASSSPMKSIIRNLEALGITGYFDTIVSGMEVEKPKPNPDIFIQAAKNLKAEPDECIVIEDSCNGVKAAKAAKMACLGFVNQNSGNQDLSLADYLFEDFTNIDEAFIRMVHNHCFMLPWKVMETERLVIREVSPEDIDRLFEIYASGEITDYMEDLYPREEELEYMKKYIENIYGFYGYGMWITELNGEVIGRAGIEYYAEWENSDDELKGELVLQNSDSEPENEENDRKTDMNNEGYHMLGYVTDKKYQNKGYAFEACSAIIEYAAKELELKRLYVRIHKDNIKSIKLAEKLGFKF